MIPLHILGINHDSASVEVRERVAFAPEALESALRQLLQQTTSSEAAILSTCNRTEIYTASEQINSQALLEWLASYHQIEGETLASCHYYHQSDDALQHMMTVACGLDSMILGEPQILGQLKSCYAVAQSAGSLGSELHSAFQKTFSVAKKVRTDTAIGENPVSVAYAAVNLSRHIFADLGQQKALLIGAGETIDLVARHLQQQGVKQMVFANRTLERAEQLAREFEAKAVLLADIPEQLIDADIVISSTASQLPILGKGMVESALKERRHRQPRHNQPVFMVDIAVPRDIEPEVAELDDVYLYTVDDLKGVIDENRQSRENAASEAKDIIQHSLEGYLQEARARHSVSVIKSYRQHAESLRDEVLDKALKDLSNGENAEAVLRFMANTLTNKLLHTPTKQLKQASSEGDQELLELTQKLFTIDQVGKK